MMAGAVFSYLSASSQGASQTKHTTGNRIHVVNLCGISSSLVFTTNSGAMTSSPAEYRSVLRVCFQSKHWGRSPAHEPVVTEKQKQDTSLGFETVRYFLCLWCLTFILYCWTTLTFPQNSRLNTVWMFSFPDEEWVVLTKPCLVV